MTTTAQQAQRSAGAVHNVQAPQSRQSSQSPPPRSGSQPEGTEAPGSGPGTEAPASAAGAPGRNSARPQGPAWEELVTAALLGTERRTPPGGGGAAELLDAAAVETVRRRAGLRPARAGERRPPAPLDTRPPLPPAASRRLASLLAARPESNGSGSARRRGPDPDLAELLPQWLAFACGQGYRAPAAQLPALLDAARSRTDLRTRTLEFAGPRALWLAESNPDWRFALRHGVRTGTAGAAGAETGGEAAASQESEETQQLWEEGLFAERVALLTSIRRRDAASGLALLQSTWSQERAEDRLMFLDSLREGLCPSDEEFLERALGDRSRTVRATAAELLSGLPESALAVRMAARARTCVALDPLSDAPRAVVEAPHECDADMQRDGVVLKPPAGRGERAWWLGQLVESAPLSTWHAQFGGRSAAEIVALPVADGWRQDLHSAWCRAAVRQRNVEWARALAGSPGTRQAEGHSDPAGLLLVLPEAERAEWAARFIEAHGLTEAFRVLEVCAVPWTEQLGRAVVDALEIARDQGTYPWRFSGAMGLAERCLPPSDAARLEPLAAVPDEPEGGSPGAGAYWAEAFMRLVATLRLRAEMQAELREEAARQQE
ncbi:hypothetical protein H181DRAFT_01078 [Streptomyces sp. WMMB 714]|uniref:DUF5691 domain-containing protein n=1 Tax=Streptomyces sp. WMMB 714 TaxID=1286822 RepID=UPI0008237B00|nr:DUF5691 domain-containing protein [Streptomyces sp. WMMB 714]SCK15886.1 hypothetical protein H181DRAFT_01078 [Streptomyces sp. WMMB 714]